MGEQQRVGERSDTAGHRRDGAGALGSFRGTFGATMNGQVQRDLFYAKARNYKTTLESSPSSSIDRSSKPEIPGIWTSRNTTSGRRRRMA